jgi:hypothetical protein
MKRLLHFLTLALTALLAAGGQARAGVINGNVNWNYNWEPSTKAVFSDNGTGGVTLSDRDAAPATNSSFVVATNLRILSSADPDHVEVLNKHGALTLTLTITDDASKKTGTFVFTGKLGGFFSSGQSNVTWTNTGKSVEALTIGKHTYTVSFYSFSPPSPTQASNKGSITYRVDVGNAATGGSSNPEPASLVLSLLGASFVGGSVWRRRTGGVGCGVKA